MPASPASAVQDLGHRTGPPKGPYLSPFRVRDPGLQPGQVSSMTEEASQWRVPIPAGQAGYLIATAARAPSVHNTQPWRFRVGEYVIELYADPGRKLRVDRAGREMLISCGAALFGLRLAVRSLGYL